MAMLAVSCLSSFALRAIEPFLVLYAVNVIGFTKTSYGLLETVRGLLATIFAMPGGILSDKFGRKKLILSSRLLVPFMPLGLVLLRHFNHVFILYVIIGIGYGLGSDISGRAGGAAWQALVTDLSPYRDRGKVLGLMSTVTGLTSTPASLTGGYLWEAYNPNSLMFTSFTLSVIAVLFFSFFVKEPKEREK